MKKIVVLGLILILSLALASCGDLLDNLMGVTIPSRLNKFVEKINAGDWSNIYRDLHPDAESYEQAKSGSFWSALFPEENYTVPYIPPLDGIEEGTKIMTTTINYTVSGSSASDVFLVTFKQDSAGDWYILKIIRDTSELFKVVP